MSPVDVGSDVSRLQNAKVAHSPRDTLTLTRRITTNNDLRTIFEPNTAIHIYSQHLRLTRALGGLEEVDLHAKQLGTIWGEIIEYYHSPAVNDRYNQINYYTGPSPIVEVGSIGTSGVR
ncbi:hypothetical protein BP5796_02079 [Coleophoma crateriformis]|uniref:Uncharacterized protein n=1 Tax=Coleophoma crateriformis TaxID=565419 RepID=A0A3D8SXB4_9HELO|nr:hypothetical protein BP5796_02079 [Coleophoma crateriformis]